MWLWAETKTWNRGMIIDSFESPHVHQPANQSQIASPRGSNMHNLKISDFHGSGHSSSGVVKGTE